MLNCLSVRLSVTCIVWPYETPTKLYCSLSQPQFVVPPLTVYKMLSFHRECDLSQSMCIRSGGIVWRIERDPEPAEHDAVTAMLVPPIYVNIHTPIQYTHAPSCRTHARGKKYHRGCCSWQLNLGYETDAVSGQIR